MKLINFCCEAHHSRGRAVLRSARVLHDHQKRVVAARLAVETDAREELHLPVGHLSVHEARDAAAGVRVALSVRSPQKNESAAGGRHESGTAGAGQSNTAIALCVCSGLASASNTGSGGSSGPALNPIRTRRILTSITSSLYYVGKIFSLNR